MKVEIWSDVVCPWCHVGLARFEEAVRRLGWDDQDIQIEYRPFELDPRVPPEGVDLADYLKAKFGPTASIRAIEGRVDEAGAEVGISFEWAGVRRINTFDAHRLLEWALATAGPATQVQLKRRLMKAYFEEVGDVAGPESLAALAAEVGLDADDARTVLASDRFGEEVRAGEAEARELDIHAVPTFVIERRLAIPGAQDPETFVAMLARMRSRLDEELSEAKLPDGASASDPGGDGARAERTGAQPPAGEAADAQAAASGLACAADDPSC